MNIIIKVLKRKIYDMLNFLLFDILEDYHRYEFYSRVNKLPPLDIYKSEMMKQYDKPITCDQTITDNI